MWALALLIELGPHKDRLKLWTRWELNPRPSGLITAAPPTELQGQTGAVHYVQVTLTISGDNDMNGDTNKFFMTTVTKTGPLTREANLHPGLLRKIFF